MDALSPVVPAASAPRSDIRALDNHVARLRASDVLIADALAAAQYDSATRHDASHATLHLQPGQLVLLAAAASRQLPTRAIPGTATKLEPRWLGPFPVERVIGPRTYRLALPPTLSIHPVVDVSKLTPFRPSDPALFPARILRPPPAPVTVDGHLEWRVDRVLAKRGAGPSTRYLVQWKGYHHSDATWEPPSHLANARAVLRRFDPAVPARGLLTP